MVRQNDARHTAACGELNFKRIPFDLASDGAYESKSRPLVVGFGTEHQSGTASRLFVSGLRIEGEHIRSPASGMNSGIYQASLPFGAPQSVS